MFLLALVLQDTNQAEPCKKVFFFLGNSQDYVKVQKLVVDGALIYCSNVGSSSFSLYGKILFYWELSLGSE